MTGNDECVMGVGWEALAEAIVLQALKDVTSNSIDCLAHRQTAEAFLKSDYCEYLTGINGKYLLKKVRELK